MQRHDFIAADGVRIAFYEVMEGDDPPIVLQHGFSSSFEHEWVLTGIVETLKPLGRRLIAVDARGHGRSEKPHESSSYGESRMADDVIELVGSLGLERYDLLGYSMGGVIATVVAARDPRLGRVVIGGVGEAVVLTGGVDTRALDAATLAAGLRTTEPETLTGIVADFRAGAEARDNDLTALAAHCDTILPRQLSLDRIGAAALVLAGDNDPLAVHPERLAAAIPGARLHLVPGDHGSARLTPEFAAALLGFLG